MTHTSLEHSMFIIRAHLTFSFLLRLRGFSVYVWVLIVAFDAVLSKAQLLLRELQELLKWCTSTDNAQQTWHRMVCLKYFVF